MNSNGIKINVDDGNHLEIDDSCEFFDCKITVKGTGNKINLMAALSYSGLKINLIGNNKEITISPSIKKIMNLKIHSIRGNNQKVLIGQNFGCGGVEISLNDGCENVVIGEDCLFSWGIKIRTSDGHSVVDLISGKAINIPRDVIIGNHVWVGEDAKFLKGAIVGNDSVVGAYSVVTKGFSQNNVLIAGFPARVIKDSITWDRRRPAIYNLEKD